MEAPPHVDYIYCRAAKSINNMKLSIGDEYINIQWPEWGGFYNSKLQHIIESTNRSLETRT